MYRKRTKWVSHTRKGQSTAVLSPDNSWLILASLSLPFQKKSAPINIVIDQNVFNLNTDWAKLLKPWPFCRLLLFACFFFAFLLSMLVRIYTPISHNNKTSDKCREWHGSSLQCHFLLKTDDATYWKRGVGFEEGGSHTQLGFLPKPSQLTFPQTWWQD